MKKFNVSIIAIAMALGSILSSCAMTKPVLLTSEPIGTHKGVSTSTVLFGVWFLNGNYGLNDATKKGKITESISIVDQKITNYIFFQKYELIVYGSK